VPVENGVVSDSTRIERVAPAITEIADKGGKVILLSHFGRPKGCDPKQSLKPVAAEVSRIIKRPVKFADDCIGEIAEQAVAAMKPGDILCLENTRFHAGEEKNDPAFVSALAKLGDIWVNDAFSAAHRAHASTEGLGHKLPAYAGRTMQAELEALANALENPQRPLTAIVGGAKVSTKLDLLGNLLDKVNALIIGGAMANTFLLAQGKNVGKSLAEPDLVPTAREIMDKAKSEKREIILPVDVVTAPKLEANASSRVLDADKVGGADMILDIGPRSVEQVVSVLARAKTLVWNGPFGAFEVEPFDNGTVEVAEAAAELTEAGKLVSVAGGGDTVAALNVAGVADRLTYVSAAGGAFLEWLEGKRLPGVEVLRIK
jgi:phosphoglycerate kinase